LNKLTYSFNTIEAKMLFRSALAQMSIF